MFIPSEYLFLAFFAVTVAAGIYTVIQLRLSRLKEFELTITYLGGLSVILLSTSIYLSIKTDTEIEQNRRAYDSIKNVQHMYLQPQKKLMHLYPEGFFLYASMNQDIDLSDVQPKSYNATKRELVELYGAIHVLQTIEYFLIAAPQERPAYTYSWWNVFLLWMQSPILRNVWQSTAASFDPETNALINVLIEKADDLIALRKKKKILTRADYDAISIPLAQNYSQRRATR